MSIFDLIGEFSWNFGQEFYIETDQGNFIWSSPDYQGNHTIIKTLLSFNKWIDPKNQGIYARSKGIHKIRDYCLDAIGSLPTIINEE